MAVSKDGPQYRFVIPDTRTTSRFRVRADARPGMTAWKFQSMIRKKPAPHLDGGVGTGFRSGQTRSVCPEIMLRHSNCGGRIAAVPQKISPWAGT